MVTLNPSQAIACPQCRNPIAAQLEQVFDTTVDPTAKQRFLRGQFNVVQCSNCGFQGMIAAPLVYHDADKELLLTYMPVELSMPPIEKERVLGQLTRAVVSRLPTEGRKGYLLQPKEMLTPQGMVEHILEADGITPEMLAEQRHKVDLLREMLAMDAESLPDFVREKDADLDPLFFELFTASAQQTAASGDAEAAAKFEQISAALMEHSSLGAESRAQNELFDATARELHDLGDTLDRNKLLDLILAAADEQRTRALATLARPLIDYEFFLQLTQRIDAAVGDERARLEALREVLLDAIGRVDAQAQAQSQAIGKVLEALLTAEDQDAAIMQLLPAIDETFLELLAMQQERARREGNSDFAEKVAQLQANIMRVLQESAPPEISFINQLLEIDDDDEAAAYLKRRAAELTPELLQMMETLAKDVEARGRAAIAARLVRYREMAERQLALAKWTS